MPADTRFPAVVLAGGPPDRVDELAASRGVAKKSLIPIAGQPMVSWVVDALLGSELVDRVVLVGLEPGEVAPLPQNVTCQPACGSMLDNVLTGLDRVGELDPAAEMVIGCSADIPLIAPKVVRWFVDACQETDHDLYYGIVEQATMEARFPGSGRTFVPMPEGRFAGGDLYMLRIARARTAEALVRQLMEERKNYLKQVRLIGIWPLVRFLLRRLDIPAAERIVSHRLGLRMKAIISPYAEVGMDADKPYQLEMIESALQALLPQRIAGGTCQNVPNPVS